MSINHSMNIDYNGGSPIFNPDPGLTELNPGDSVTLNLTNAPSDASIDSVTIYGNKVVNGQDQKDTSNVICGWSRSGGNTCQVYQIAANSQLQVTLTDEEHPDAPENFWFSAGGSPSWSVDPELQNEPESGG